MPTKKTNFIFGILIALVVAAGAVLYPHLPEQVASHWNAAGEVDGYMGKFWGVFLFPAIMLAFFLLYLVIPKIDPLKKNLEAFRSHYNMLWLGLMVFFAYIFALSMIWNMGIRFDFSAAMMLAIGALFYIIGGLLENSKRNWFVGIRTPWTLSSDTVWDKTHKMGGRLFKVAGVLSALSVLLPASIGFIVVVASVLFAAVFSIVYSYLVYRREKKGQDA